jgi:hypothetical protein
MGPTVASITETLRPIFGAAEFVLLQGDIGLMVIWCHPTMTDASDCTGLHEQVLDAMTQIVPFGIGRSIMHCPNPRMWLAVQTMAEMGCSVLAIEGLMGLEHGEAPEEEEKDLDC